MNGAAAESVTEKLHVPKKLQSYAPGTRHKRNPVQQAADLTIKAMLVQGASIRKVAAALNISPTTVSRVKARMCEQSPDAVDLKISLMSPKRDENTGKLIDHFINKGLKMKKIKGSDALGAVKMYADRRWPVQQAAQPAPRVSFIQINVDCLRSDLRLDATPTTICSDSDSGKIEIDVNPCNITDASVR